MEDQDKKTEGTTEDEREATIQDLDVSEQDSEGVKGGAKSIKYGQDL